MKASYWQSILVYKTCHCYLLNLQSGSRVQNLPCCIAAYYTTGCWLWEKVFETSILRLELGTMLVQRE